MIKPKAYSKLTEEDKNLLTTQGFINAYWKNLRDSKTNLDAYELTEDQHEKAFGRRKYTGFNSFQTTKKRFMNKRR